MGGKMGAFVEVTIDDQQLRFHTRDQLVKWWAHERAHWNWLWASGGDDFRNIGNIANSLDSLVKTGKSDEIVASLLTFFNRGRMGVPISSSFDGRRYLNAVDLAGADDARLLVIIEQNQHLRNNLQSPHWIYGFSRAAAASYSGFGDNRAEMNAERHNYRRAVDRLAQRVRDLEGEKDEFIKQRSQHVKALSRRLMRRTFAIWRGAAIEFGQQRDEAISAIQETEEQYRRQMALKAPVEYWINKANVHGLWEMLWVAMLVIYFVIAVFGIFSIADWAKNYLLDVAEGSHATPTYIIIGGASLGATTLIFWIGRLLAKLFLSEHHLRSDAREKAVMTQAFLSMETRETFSPEERAIILASIFRSSPDGIVKDEGPHDLSSASLLARAVGGRSPI